MFQRLSYNDAVLLVSLAYYTVDVISEWTVFSTCTRPVHHWLLATFISIASFRLSHVLGFWAWALGDAGATAAEGEATGSSLVGFLLDLRPKGVTYRLLLSFSWGLAVPCLAVWTMLGTSWFWAVSRDSPDCLPSETYHWFACLFLLVCYGWIGLIAALGVKAMLLERQVRQAEGRLREVESDDVLRRWGPISHLSSHRDLNRDEAQAPRTGLSPAAIKALPLEVAAAHQPWSATEAAEECSICLAEVEPGEKIRRLPGCGHTFHGSCIDVWLVNQANCPLCKRHVEVEDSNCQCVV